MWKPFIIGTILATIIIFFLNSMLNSALAETNTVSSTVVTNNTPPTANAPSVVVNNSDVCRSSGSIAVQHQILGVAVGKTTTDENCERLKLSRSLYAMGMEVSAISVLCQDSRTFDAMIMAGTPCPYMGAIGEEAKQGWLDNMDMIPEGSVVFAKIQEVKAEEEKTNHTVRDLNDFEKFVIVGMAMYIGVPIIF